MIRQFELVERVQSYDPEADEDVLNRILWRATMGGKPYPEWAVKPVVDDD